MTRSRQRTRTRSKGKPVQIDRVKRRFLHAIWPHLIAGAVGNAASELEYHCRVERQGLTPGEIVYLKKQEDKLREVHSDLLTIYFRLKK